MQQRLYQTSYIYRSKTVEAEHCSQTTATATAPTQKHGRDALNHTYFFSKWDSSSMLDPRSQIAQEKKFDET